MADFLQLLKDSWKAWEIIEKGYFPLDSKLLLS